MFFIAVHAGAGEFDAVTRSRSQAACKLACSKASEFDVGATEHSSLINRCVDAVALLEDCPETNAGMGSNLTMMESVECDASIMDGTYGSFGGVTGATEFKNPIRAARAVMDLQKQAGTTDLVPPLMLTVSSKSSIAALKRTYSSKRPLEIVRNDSLITKRSIAAFRHAIAIRNRQENAVAANVADDSFNDLDGSSSSQGADTKILNHNPSTSFNDVPHINHSTNQKEPMSSITNRPNDTVGCVGVSASGSSIAATSSGGNILKWPGRIGPAAVFGCGCFAMSSCATDNRLSVAVSVSGSGEHLLRNHFAQALGNKLIQHHNSSARQCSGVHSESNDCIAKSSTDTITGRGTENLSDSSRNFENDGESNEDFGHLVGIVKNYAQEIISGQTDGVSRENVATTNSKTLTSTSCRTRVTVGCIVIVYDKLSRYGELIWCHNSPEFCIAFRSGSQLKKQGKSKVFLSTLGPSEKLVASSCPIDFGIATDK